ncbi:MAG: ABC transporter ATP-binding protein [Candidatus Kapaibacterium sp.]|jgi:ABC-type multidrug transport system ATPase subunit|nr:ABC transporter ATP-binding protein [Candidatus Kapabacteria bacterium]HRE59038.1 ABC transporter ATP-binding protein [Candidatus Kapabacteria bacterium]
MTHAQPVIEIRGLTKDFGNFRAVDNLDLTVYRGDIFGFLGPNGAGKSTTIRMLMTLIRPTSGSISVFGHSLFTHRNEILRNIGAIVEKPDFYLYLSAFKNMELLGRLSGADTSRSNIMKVLELVNLHERAESKVKTFSYGMKQRLGIAQALLHNPQLIILDEPTNGLDPVGVKEMRDLILMLANEQEKTIFLSSHILPEVEMIANRMAIINKGKTVVEGEVRQLLLQGHSVVRFTTSEPDKALELLRQSPWSKFITMTDNADIMLDMERNDTADINEYLVNNGIAVLGIEAKRSLEEYFLSITKHSGHG